MINKKYTVLGETIKKGKGAQLNLDIAKLHTRTKIEVPVIVQRGKKDGPTLLITGGIHGNEINGVEIVRQLVSNKYNMPECGMVICIPVVNIFGFLNQTRQFPDGRDLNRVFPGSLRGSLASRFAYHLVKDIAPVIDYCIDYHTGGDSRFNAPQIRIDKDDADGLALAKIFGAEFIVKSAGREKSFRETLHKLDKKVLLYEGGKSLHIDKEITDTGVVGALRMMQHLGMRNFEKELAQYLTLETTPKLVHASKWSRAKHSGMFHPTVHVGQKIKKGGKLGSISGPFGYFEKKILAKNSGYIICINQSPIVNQGDAIFHIAYDVE
ncbi:succinylglutamate desuccinylase/aspartoacylase family protein [Maribacter hydrothermalis]|uniref:Succinylglutamate desuccinylase n=1 Tax=Maribacter hydrothermalis TaxID=1836467 RepID=A0A1B7Z6M9_9FLAO|nr:succinylglutamate desuccinylase/aspartoacylase family protein [Maribacter hydrothermalis]APQ18640.1 succinylglutamate desuccinylase [Maribacter hydrothermalis]OBR38368.1 succinylglutamate desuccinylase [Maribacter hydrothermalis]